MLLPKTIQDLVPNLWGKRDQPVVRGEDDDPFLSLHREVNRAFTTFWRTAEIGPFGGGLTPRADIVETGQAIEVSLELPGLDETDVDVSVAGGLLTVKAEKKLQADTQGVGWHLAERSYGRIQRTLSLPPNLDPERAEARFRNGVLTITVPKSSGAAAVRKIDVKKV